MPFAITPKVNYDEELLEESLKRVISQHRTGLGLTTKYDEDLGHMLGQMLDKYELSVSTSSRYDGSQFSESIKNHIPLNFVFKAFPIQVKSRSVLGILESVKSNDVGLNLLESSGDQMQFGVRTKICLYPEGVEAVWIMISCYFIEI